MAIINSENLKAISKGFKKEFNEFYQKTQVDYPKVATTFKANTISVSYAWLGDFPKMKEWVGERQVQDLKAHSYEISKKRFELTLEVDRDYILHDSLGIVKPRIQQMAADAASHYDEIVFPLLEKNGKCYDGKNFFDEHTSGNVKVANIGDLKLTQENFLLTRSNMMSLKGDNGKKLGIKPNLLVVPPNLEATALKILKADMIDGDSNIAKDMAEILVCADLSDPQAWYLLDSSKPLKPLILQINKPVSFTAQDNPHDEAPFMKAKFRYGIDCEDNAGYGLWQLGYKQTGKK